MKTFLSIILTILLFSGKSLADDSMAVDDADDFNPQEFHKKNTDEIKLYDSSTGTFFSRESSTAVPTAESSQKNQHRFKIRVRYSIDLNNKALATAASATNQLHQQMAHHCPQGWNKNKEWSVAEGKDYFLHYEFQCL